MRLLAAAVPDPTSPAVLIPFLLGMVGLFAAFQVYYWVGHKLGPKIYASRLGRRIGDEKILRAERFVARWGALSVYACFWVPGVRHTLPWVAGVLKISYPKYVAASALGCLTWCPVTYFGLYSVIWGWLALAGRSPAAAGAAAAVAVAAAALLVRRRRAALRAEKTAGPERTADPAGAGSTAGAGSAAAQGSASPGEHG
ncbi:DedA family protein [Planomonospora venezuelensis]|uniref:Membrane protein DedA with SNARE-associated domain n=1 Tax=Planomonospora venezuelensis TaxID=1999 RepID=A0A841D1Z2_PLAVE|nr:VTT domain-containing protein [Planomonospora venezuelensis]MBB5962347.1 membrane protein DedA with SNARE-associated domain [Planomonospora venezuelensis]